MREFQASDCPGDGGRAVADDAVLGRSALGVELHVARRCRRGAFAEIDEISAAVGESDKHESAATQVSGGGMRDGERESHSHRGVDGVATRLEDFDADIGCVRLHSDYHGVLSADGLTGAPAGLQ